MARWATSTRSASTAPTPSSAPSSCRSPKKGIAAGEPVIIGYDDRKSRLLRSWLTDPSAVTVIGDKSLYATPARAIATYRRLFEFHVAMGAGRIRIAGDVPHPGNGGRFEGWDRYESAVNTVWQDFPYGAGACTTPRPRPRRCSTWPNERTPVSSRRRDSGGRATATKAPWYSKASRTHPIHSKTPRPLSSWSTDPLPTPGHALTGQIGPGRIPGTTLDDLLIGVSEAVSNAQRHGRPPATVRIWATPGRIVVTVHDKGRGPADRLAGLVPAPGNISDRRLGLGLWAMHQLDIDVALRHADDGFTVRLRSGTIPG